jgi:hypothetical protein
LNSSDFYALSVASMSCIFACDALMLLFGSFFFHCPTLTKRSYSLSTLDRNYMIDQSCSSPFCFLQFAADCMSWRRNCLVWERSSAVCIWMNSKSRMCPPEPLAEQQRIFSEPDSNPLFLDPFSSYLAAGDNDTHNFGQMLTAADRPHFELGMQEEMTALKKNDMFDIVPTTAAPVGNTVVSAI